MALAQYLLIGFAVAGAALATSTTGLATPSCPSLEVKNTGDATGYYKNLTNGIMSYQAGSDTTTKVIIHLTNLDGIPYLENKLLTDSFTANGYKAIMPNLFDGEPVSETDTSVNLTAWKIRHPDSRIDTIINETISYVRDTYPNVKSIGAVGYCFGGKYLTHFLSAGYFDAGFTAHPSLLTDADIEGVVNPISIAAGTLDTGFNSTQKAETESILNANNVTFQTNLYYGAPHGFAVQEYNETEPLELYAKQASFIQAVTWFNSWL